MPQEQPEKRQKDKKKKKRIGRYLKSHPETTNIKNSWSPVYGSVVTNPTSIHEDAGSVPGLA